ncbi:hypothetical protein M436DRAFT_63864 [Aureobasidium namibiae CBS 147.97]|uniref:Apple domain-containing protein n=1 Tax=Aureobasidium namibiae CBS 147.97 TaxID=1043004 RepID=A0A074WPP8_9PEZI|nr:uncharacterized protein M436DRAFT_63864 [Aureobasidium namibiae CBS 147.97]KEQ73584.1 hypothetical protein M436DRAFT_63864 [Aureobasidium namibiae CBS 147.97]
MPPRYNGQRCAGKLYPVAVSCVDYVQVRSKITLVLTTKTSTKTLPSSTVTVTSYTVSTSTSTVVPPEVSTTSSFSTTVSTTTTATFQATTTTTTTTTLTVTSTLAGYDACATNNLLGPSYNGDIIDNESAAAGGYSTDPSATTAYDCCVSCLNSDTCSGTAFLTDGNLCLQITGATCTNVQQNAGSFYYEPSGQGTGDSYIVSNSNCGYLTDGGVGG